jgi:hypothetical protein
LFDSTEACKRAEALIRECLKAEGFTSEPVRRVVEQEPIPEIPVEAAATAASDDKVGISKQATGPKVNPNFF